MTADQDFFGIRFRGFDGFDGSDYATVQRLREDLTDCQQRLAECERERDETAEELSTTFSLNCDLLAENRVLREAIDNLPDESPCALHYTGKCKWPSVILAKGNAAHLVPLTAAEVDRVKALEQANRELRVELEWHERATKASLNGLGPGCGTFTNPPAPTALEHS